MNFLEDYTEKLNIIRKKLGEGKSVPMDAFYYQELKYRISTIETLNAFNASAPVTKDEGVIGLHYEIVGMLLKNLLDERSYGNKTNEEGVKKRTTAKEALTRIFEDGKHRFSGIKITTNELYRDNIKDLINTYLAVWIQYRDTLIKI